MKYFWSLICAFLCVGQAYADEKADLSSPLMQEVFYTTYEQKIIKDIEREMVKNGFDADEAALVIGYVKVHIDMLDVKKNVMACMKQKNLGFASQNKKDIQECFYEYKEQIDVANLIARNDDNATVGMLVAEYFRPKHQKLAGDDRDRLLIMMKNVAISLAISRMDVQNLYEDVYACMIEQDVTNSAEKCVSETETIFRRELTKAMDELIPYVDFFALNLLKAEDRVKF